MRLIDADAFLERMKGTDRYFSIKFDIEEQPTAYDIDKVMELLETEKRECCKQYEERVKQHDIRAESALRGNIYAFQKSIEIMMENLEVE